MSYRKVWFITRPERDPKFHRKALLALQRATDDFTIKWVGNCDVHKKYEMELFMSGLKREHISNDGSIGRTWTALMKTFSYCYASDDGYLVPTKVGISILEGKNVRKNITKQILTLQIPNSYFLEPGFKPKFHIDFAIRPARFLIKLCNCQELNYYLTREEVIYFALTAYKDNDLLETVDKIKLFRKLDGNKKVLLKEEIAKLYKHREGYNDVMRNFEKKCNDIAHTFMTICDYTGLVEYIRGKALRINPADSTAISNKINDYDKKYPFNKRYLISLQRMAENSGLDVDNCNTLNNSFIEYYLSEQSNTAFVDKISKIFKALGFKVVKRPTQTFSVQRDILLKYGKDWCAIIDTINCKECFFLSAALVSHMSSVYIPNYEGFEKRKVGFFGYVTASKFSGEKNLKKISKMSAQFIKSRDIKGIMLSTDVLLSLLDYCIDNNIPREKRAALFINAVDNRAYSTIKQLIKYIDL